MSAEALAHGAADRLHDVRGERSNVPRVSAGLYGAGDIGYHKSGLNKRSIEYIALETSVTIRRIS